MAWILLALVIALVAYLYIQNYLIEVTHYTITIPALDKRLKGKKLVHLTDLHFKPRTNKSYVETIIEKTKEADPDYIMLTGDLVQGGLQTLADTPLRRFAELCTAIAPTFAITGNHDIQSGTLNEFQSILSASRVKLLVDEAVTLSVDDEELLVIMGLAERQNQTNLPQPILKPIELTSKMEKLPKILLAHRPEYFEHYTFDKTKSPALTLSGHTHAGQVRLPFIGGLFAPGQGMLPEFDYGVFNSEEDRSKRMLISRGLGNSSFPLRINNRPQIVVVTLN